MEKTTTSRQTNSNKAMLEMRSAKVETANRSPSREKCRSSSLGQRHDPRGSYTFRLLFLLSVRSSPFSAFLRDLDKVLEVSCDLNVRAREQRLGKLLVFRTQIVPKKPISKSESKITPMETPSAVANALVWAVDASRRYAGPSMRSPEGGKKVQLLSSAVPVNPRSFNDNNVRVTVDDTGKRSSVGV